MLPLSTASQCCSSSAAGSLLNSPASRDPVLSASSPHHSSTSSPHQSPYCRLCLAVAKVAPSLLAQPTCYQAMCADTQNHTSWVPVCTCVHQTEHLWKVSIFFLLNKTPASNLVPAPGAWGASVAMAEGTWRKQQATDSVSRPPTRFVCLCACISGFPNLTTVAADLMPSASTSLWVVGGLGWKTRQGRSWMHLERHGPGPNLHLS